METDRIWTGSLHLEPLVRPVAEIHLDEQNTNLHEEDSIAAIQGSIRDNGQQTPILCARDGDRIVVTSGNGVLAAIRRLGWTHIAAAIGEMEIRMARLYGFVDNESGRSSVWNPGRLVMELERQKQRGVRASQMGFSDSQVKTMVKRAAESHEAPEERVKTSVVIECASEAQQAEILGELMEDGLDCRALVS